MKKKSKVESTVRIGVSQPKSKTYYVNQQISEDSSDIFSLPADYVNWSGCGPVALAIYKALKDVEQISKFGFPDRMSIRITKTKFASWEAIDARVILAIKDALGVSEAEVFNT